MNTIFKILTCNGIFVDERLLGKGIYVTSKPALHSENTTVEILADNIKQYYEYLSADNSIGRALECLEKCTLEEYKLVKI